jgi:hypothetical protein
MSDTTVAPPSATPTAPAPAPAAPAAAEVPINQNPVNIPTPVSSQLPPAEGRRQSIQKAFDRANQPQAKPAKPAEKPAPKAAEAKLGHNQPPEETPQERLDLRKRPSDQPRGERGQFAPRQVQDAQNAQKAQNAAAAPGVAFGTQSGQAQTQPQLPNHAPFRDPPARMAQVAKEAWHATPEVVRGDVHRMHQEFANAYQQYRGDHDTMNTIRMFQDLATKHGTTLQKALTSYVSMENKLRADPVAGLDQIVNNLGLKTADGQPIGLRDIAYHVLTQTPEQLRQLQQGNAQSAASQQIGALHREISGLKQAVNQMHTAQQFTHTRSAVDIFADSHPRFDEIGDLIEAELKAGYDLPTAYQRADLLRPATHAAQTRSTPAQTRPVDRSIYGAPDVGPSNGSSRSRQPSGSPREAVQRALRQLNTSL